MGEDAAYDSVEELYYADEGIGFAYNEDRTVRDFVIYSKEIEVGYGLRGGMTYPELTASFTGEVGPLDEYTDEHGTFSANANCIVYGDPNTEEGWLESCYEWRDDPYTTAGELHLGYVRT